MIHPTLAFSSAALLVAALLISSVACSGSSPPGSSVVSGGGPSAGSSPDDEERGGNRSGGTGGAGTVGEAAAGDASLGGAAGTAGGHGGEPGGPILVRSGPLGECNAVTTEYVLEAGTHVTSCTAIDYASNPPSSGAHYPTWADFGEYDFPLPRGFWMHNLEHGAVVVTYRCPAGCTKDLSAARAWLAGLMPDSGCDPGSRARVLLLPDPELDVAWAAAAWGHTLRADCFDPALFSAFYLAHAGQPPAPEAVLCGTGFDFRTEGADTCGARGTR